MMVVNDIKVVGKKGAQRAREHAERAKKVHRGEELQNYGLASCWLCCLFYKS